MKSCDTPNAKQKAEEAIGIDRLLAVVAQLRDPTGGCPWDLKQTHQSLKPFLLEEAYEVLDVIDEIGQIPSPNQPLSLSLENALKEELGDLLLQVTLHAQLAHDRQAFNFTDVAEAIATKLIRRHPHVFGDTVVNGTEDVLQNWETIKAQEKAEKNPEETSSSSILNGVSKHLPALLRGTELSKRAVKVGFKWPNDDSLWRCVMSEFDEFRAETHPEDGQAKPNLDKLEDEMGDILFATISLANHYGVDPETALARANTKFTRRFQAMETLADRPLEQLSFEAWDTLWRQAKNLSLKK